MALRFASLKLAARALPPLDAPSADSACACTFLPSAGFRISPVDSSTTRRAFCIGSARLPPLLARVGIGLVCLEANGAINGLKGEYYASTIGGCVMLPDSGFDRDCKLRRRRSVHFQGDIRSRPGSDSLSVFAKSTKRNRIYRFWRRHRDHG